MSSKVWMELLIQISTAAPFEHVEIWERIYVLITWITSNILQWMYLSMMGLKLIDLCANRQDPG